MRVLLLLQGINKKANYIEEELKKSNFDFSIYDQVEYINTEQFFDEVLESIPELVRGKMVNKCSDNCAVPDYEAKAGWMDYGIDIWAFFVNRTVYRKLLDLVESRVKFHKDNDKHVHIVSHSLGTLIGLHADININRFYSFASPLGFEFAPLRGLIKLHLFLRGKKFFANSVINIWGAKDYISRQMNDGGDKAFRKRCYKYKEYKVFTGHSLLDQVNQYLDKLIG